MKHPKASISWVLALAGTVAAASVLPTAWAQSSAGAGAGAGAPGALARRGNDLTLAQALEGHEARVSQLIGKRVTSPAGADLGEVEDLLAAEDSDTEPTVVISVGGVLDVGDKWYATSFEDLLVAPNDALVLDKTEDELAQEPAFDYLPRAGERSHQPGVTGPGTTNSIGSLLGATVVDERGETIGEIDDLVVSSRGEHDLRAIVALDTVALNTAELDENAGRGADGRLVAIPYDELVVEESGEEARALPQQPRVRLELHGTPVEALPTYEYSSREVI